MEEKIIEILNESVDTRYTYEELSLKVNSFFDNMNYEEFNTWNNNRFNLYCLLYCKRPVLYKSYESNPD